jgi:anti-anti-sigma regulatory factor
MAIAANTAGQSRTIRLDGSVDIASGVELQRELREALEAEGGLSIDIRALEKVDVIALQLLMAAKREAIAAGHEFCIDGSWNPGIESRLQQAGISPSQIFATQQAER